ncbi:MAG: ParB/RepB/Spo0J family partition protein [Oscillospiraceae bacterium]|nr:ParB/RepB/Spo0J family partition protein [Oscillospiraceae bacterium]
MQRTESAARRVVMLPVGAIRPNPSQPRRRFDPDALRELADSIRRYGVLQPLTVRRVGERFELVAGERRLRAARIAGLGEVPCIPLEVSDEESGLLALVENLQRQDLDYIETARGIAQLMERYRMSQEQAARRLGKSQSAVANKLRLLRHPPEVLAALRQYGLTERHARALLRVEDTQQRLALIRRIAAEGWSVARLEQYLDRAPQQKSIWHSAVLRDARLLLNTVEHALSAARCAGLAARCGREETEREIVLTIHVPKQ